MERLQAKYVKEIVPALKQKFGFKNLMQVPRITKIVINVGIGKAKDDKKKVDAIISDVAKITGQAPVKTQARKSISGFKVRENQVIGVMCTLRGFRMYSFLDKLINVSLPRVRDFQGISDDSFDGKGNLHIGLREHLVFPEISADSLEHVFGLEVSIVTNAGRDDWAKELLKLMNFPFKSNK